MAEDVFSMTQLFSSMHASYVIIYMIQGEEKLVPSSLILVKCRNQRYRVPRRGTADQGMMPTQMSNLMEKEGHNAVHSVWCYSFF